MAYTTINKSSSFMNPTLYTGNGSTQSINVGFQPDFTWIKTRSGTTGTEGHRLQDAVRGSTKYLESNGTAQEGTQTQGVTSFTSTGFNLGTDGSYNYNTAPIVSWNWKANGAGSSNTDGNNITSTVSVNTTAGFSIVKYTGTGSASDTIGHGLGAKPAMVIMRPLGYSGAWWIAHKNLSTDEVLEFNTNGQAPISGFGGGGLMYSTFTTSVIGGGNGSSNSDLWNTSGQDYIAYCFAEKTGYSRFGKYQGNGSTDGTFIYTGFKPAFCMIKRSSTDGDDWMMTDNKMNLFNVLDKRLNPNSNGAEQTTDIIDFVSNGFKLRATPNYINGSGSTYIYMVFAENPFVATSGTSAIPVTAR